MRKRSEGHFTGEQDTLLYYQHWHAEVEPTATLIITHGMAEHSDAYARLVAGLNIPNLEIYGWDLRGHGHSEGRWGVVRHFDDFSKDFVRFVNLVSEQRGHTGPLFLLGHSMGGLVNLHALFNPTFQAELNSKVTGLVLSSPLLEVALKVPMLKEKAGRFFSDYLPNFTVANELNFDDITRDRTIVKEYEKDTLRPDRISLKFYVSLTEVMALTKGQAEQLTLPLLMQVAGNDKIVSARAAQIFFEKCASQDKHLIVYDEFYHEIYNDLGRERPYHDLTSWLIRRMKTSNSPKDENVKQPEG